MLTKEEQKMRKFDGELKDYIISHLNKDGMFTKTYTEISHDLDIPMNAVRLGILDIAKSGFIEVLTPPTRGINSNPLYRLKVNNVVVTDSHPLHNEDTKTIEFQGISIKLIDSDVGYLLGKEETAICTLENVITLDKIIESNKELFDGQVVTIDGKEYLTKRAISTFLIKLNTSNSLSIKRNLLVEFQKSVIDAMLDTHLRARLTVTNDHRINITHNLRSLLDLDKEQVDAMLIDLEYQMSKLFMTQATQLTVCDRKLNALERENGQLKNRVEIELKAKERLITEVRTCQGKLLERN